MPYSQCAYVLRATGNTDSPATLRHHLLWRRSHIDFQHRLYARRQEQAGYALLRELRVRRFYDTKSTDEAVLVVFGPDLLALLFVIGTFARESSGERFSVRPSLPPGALTIYESADSGAWSHTSSSTSGLHHFERVGALARSHSALHGDGATSQRPSSGKRQIIR